MNRMLLAALILLTGCKEKGHPVFCPVGVEQYNGNVHINGFYATPECDIQWDSISRTVYYNGYRQEGYTHIAGKRYEIENAYYAYRKHSTGITFFTEATPYPRRYNKPENRFYLVVSLKPVK